MAQTKVTSKRLPQRETTLLVTREAGRAVVWLSGEFDLSNVQELSETLTRVAALNEGDVVVDLRRVEFLGAVIVGVLVRARQILLHRSQSLVLRAPSDCARRILDLCGLAHVAELREHEEAEPPPPPNALASWVAVPPTKP